MSNDKDTKAVTAEQFQEMFNASSSIKLLFDEVVAPMQQEIEQLKTDHNLIIADACHNLTSLFVIKFSGYAKENESSPDAAVRLINEQKARIAELEEGVKYVDWWIETNNEGNNVNFDFEKWNKITSALSGTEKQKPT